MFIKTIRVVFLSFFLDKIRNNTFLMYSRSQFSHLTEFFAILDSSYSCCFVDHFSVRPTHKTLIRFHWLNNKWSMSVERQLIETKQDDSRLWFNHFFFSVKLVSRFSSFSKQSETFILYTFTISSLERSFTKDSRMLLIVMIHNRNVIHNKTSLLLLLQLLLLSNTFSAIKHEQEIRLSLLRFCCYIDLNVVLSIEMSLLTSL